MSKPLTGIVYIYTTVQKFGITFRSRLFNVDVETGVLRVLFNEAASCAPGPPTIYLRCSVKSQFALFCEGSSTQCCTRASFS